MKELEKTKRISISAILFILVIIIGVLTMKKPDITYVNCMNKSLANLIENPLIITLDNYKNNKENSIIIDIRSGFEFSKGHMDNAINMPIASLLNPKNIAVFEKAQEEEQSIVLYGANPMEANKASTFLRQIGYLNSKVLDINVTFEKYALSTKNVKTGDLIADIPTFIKKSNERKKVIIKKTVVKKPTPKKVIPIRKKKKYESEGGC